MIVITSTRIIACVAYAQKLQANTGIPPRAGLMPADCHPDSHQRFPLSPSSRTILRAILVWAVLFPHAVKSSESSKVSYSSFTAVLINYNRYGNKSPRKSRISMNSRGLRVTDVRGVDDQVHNEYIQNFKTDEAWLVATRRRVYLSLHADQSNARGSARGTPTENVSSMPGKTGGIMIQIPCQNYIGEFVGDSLWHGISVQVWNCRDEGSTKIIKQSYSMAWQMVVRQERPNGDISELHDLNDNRLLSERFSPDKSFREVDFEEFVSGIPAIKPYEETSEDW